MAEGPGGKQAPPPPRQLPWEAGAPPAVVAPVAPHMPQLIAGYNVYFPPGRKPFPAQLAAMSKMLQALSTGQNCLIESPTGSGKTLALLSASLAFQYRRRKEKLLQVTAARQAKAASRARAMAGVDAGGGGDGGGEGGGGGAAAGGRRAGGDPRDRVALSVAGSTIVADDPYGDLVDEDGKPKLLGPRIFYTSRTHSQLHQVVQELRRCTAYLNKGAHPAPHVPILPGSAAAAAAALNPPVISPFAPTQATPATSSFMVPGTARFDAGPAAAAAAAVAAATSEIASAGGLELTLGTVSTTSPILLLGGSGSSTGTGVGIDLTQFARGAAAARASASSGGVGAAAAAPGGRRHVDIGYGEGAGALLPPPPPPPPPPQPPSPPPEPELPQLRMGILASRTHLCVNQTVISAARNGGPSIDEQCRALLEAGAANGPGCPHYSGSEGLAGSMPTVWDMEDLVAAATKPRRRGGAGGYGSGCPFFASRTLAERADLVFAPYNYLLDPVIRKSLGVELEGTVVIVDEAHNIEDTSREAASLELTLEDMAEVVSDCDKLVHAGNMAAHHKAWSDVFGALIDWYRASTRALAGGGGSSGGGGAGFFRSGGGGGGGGRGGGSGPFTAGSETWGGLEALDIFASCGLSLATFRHLFEAYMALEEAKRAAKPHETQTSSKTLKTIERLLTVVGFMQSRKRLAGGAGSGPSPAAAAPAVVASSSAPPAPPPTSGMVDDGDDDGFGGGESALPEGAITGGVSGELLSASRYAEDYHMSLVPVTSTSGGGSRSGFGAGPTPLREKGTHKLCLWCMNAAVAFSEIGSLAASVVLTSGTLSPLDGFAAELGAPFPIRLENPHVINIDKQLCVSVLSGAPPAKGLVLQRRALPPVALPGGALPPAGVEGSRRLRWVWDVGFQPLPQPASPLPQPLMVPFSPCREVELLGTYVNQEDEAYLQALGVALLSVLARTPGGALVFFPSYKWLERVMEKWSRVFVTLIEPESQPQPGPAVGAGDDEGGGLPRLAAEAGAATAPGRPHVAPRLLTRSITLFDAINRVKRVFVEPSGSSGSSSGGGGGDGSRGKGGRGGSSSSSGGEDFASLLQRFKDTVDEFYDACFEDAPPPLPEAQEPAENVSKKARAEKEGKLPAANKAKRRKVMSALGGVAWAKGYTAAAAASEGGGKGGYGRRGPAASDESESTESDAWGEAGTGGASSSSSSGPATGLTGAVLLAVARGKASEGIDFSDRYARTVAIVSVPYPSAMDPAVKLKKEYQNRRFAEARAAAAAAPSSSSGGAATSSSSSSGILLDNSLMPIDGNAWYEQQAFRALNQALGRCIRHKNDYGALVFLDRRYAFPRNKASLSRWVRPAVPENQYIPLPHACTRLDAFFTALCASPPGAVPVASGGAGGAPARLLPVPPMAAAAAAAPLAPPIGNGGNAAIPALPALPRDDPALIAALEAQVLSAGLPPVPPAEPISTTPLLLLEERLAARTISNNQEPTRLAAVGASTSTSAAAGVAAPAALLPVPAPPSAPAPPPALPPAPAPVHVAPAPAPPAPAPRQPGSDTEVEPPAPATAAAAAAIGVVDADDEDAAFLELVAASQVDSPAPLAPRQALTPPAASGLSQSRQPSVHQAIADAQRALAAVGHSGGGSSAGAAAQAAPAAPLPPRPLAPLPPPQPFAPQQPARPPVPSYQTAALVRSNSGAQPGPGAPRPTGPVAPPTLLQQPPCPAVPPVAPVPTPPSAAAAAPAPAATGAAAAGRHYAALTFTTASAIVGPRGPRGDPLPVSWSVGGSGGGAAAAAPPRGPGSGGAAGIAARVVARTSLSASPAQVQPRATASGGHDNNNQDDDDDLALYADLL